MTTTERSTPPLPTPCRSRWSPSAGPLQSQHRRAFLRNEPIARTLVAKTLFFPPTRPVVESGALPQTPPEGESPSGLPRWGFSKRTRFVGGAMTGRIGVKVSGILLAVAAALSVGPVAGVGLDPAGGSLGPSLVGKQSALQRLPGNVTLRSDTVDDPGPATSAAAVETPGGGSIRATATIAHSRLVVVDGAGTLTGIWSNTGGDNVPYTLTVRMEGRDGEAIPMTDDVASRYLELLRTVDFGKRGRVYGAKQP